MALTLLCLLSSLFFFNDTATTEIYTLSLHDALPISVDGEARVFEQRDDPARGEVGPVAGEVEVVPARAADPRLERVEVGQDRKSTRLNSSHANISYAVFCLKKKISLN